MWVLADESLDSLQPGEPLKLITNEDEASEAVRNILNRTEADLRQQQLSKQQQQLAKQNKAAANRLNQQQQHQQLIPDGLQKSAEDILSGLKRPTAVEAVMTPGVKRASSALHLKGKKVISLYEKL